MRVPYTSYSRYADSLVSSLQNLTVESNKLHDENMTLHQENLVSGNCVYDKVIGAKVAEVYTKCKGLWMSDIFPPIIPEY